MVTIQSLTIDVSWYHLHQPSVVSQYNIITKENHLKK